MIIANKYKIIERIGNGEFGTIFKGENIRTREPVAIKMESTASETKMLKREAQIYQYLGKTRTIGIPQVKWYGTLNEYNYMVLPLLGPSLSNNTFSLVDTFSIGKTITKILQYIHSKGMIHRDVKPDNFVFGQNGESIYIIDFGLCKKYKDDENNHIALRSGKTIIGTPNFVSVNMHNGLEPSRRDDMESVGYIMMYLINNELPWATMRENTSIKTAKINTNINNPAISQYINYCRNLEFTKEPNYDYLLGILQS